ncbi:hypothetical protein AB0G02_19580 [Actinosynnema sp. NPDC023658]|uniref:hypothetical protein n=1 Tax=Actinosynnema sp. NPDC023658 TaxID=3155465 RepID=UPI0033FDEF6E
MRPRHALIAAAVCLAVPLLTAAPASAGIVDVSCGPPSSQTNTYSPPLTATPQTVVVNSSARYTCVSAGVPALTSGTRTVEVSSPGRSCLDLLTGFPVTLTITWNTGQTSTLSGSSTVATAGATHVVTMTGTVTAGLFAGDAVVSTAISPSAPILLCTLGLGTVSSTTSTLLLEITST